MDYPMEYQKGEAVCWSLQPAARVPVIQIPGRMVGTKPGYVVIRVFDVQESRWIDRPVRPITLRKIGPKQAALLREQEAVWPIASSTVVQNPIEKRTNSLEKLAAPEGLGTNALFAAASPTVNQCKVDKPENTIKRPAVPGALETNAPASEARPEAQDPTCHITRRQLSAGQQGQWSAPGNTKRNRSLERITDLRASIGRVRDPDIDLNLRLAYRVLIAGETLDRVAKLAGVTRERVRQRVRDGVTAALSSVPDPTLKGLCKESLTTLRHHASELKPALENAFLAIPDGTMRRLHPVRLSAQGPRPAVHGKR